MVDDTLGVSECGISAIRKNSVINSFMDTQRLKLSKEKSVAVHIGAAKKCTLPCPSLKVHSDPMDSRDKTRYLGNIISSKGGVSDTIEDRRKIGWGKISTIMGILDEVDMGANRIEAGLMLRQSILVSSLLYSAEAWSGVTDKQMARIEVVDSALLQKLTGGHSKCASEFHHLETGTWKFRHILSYKRLMFHHFILTRDEIETIHKKYKKQKEEFVKGHWYQLLKADFQLINIVMNKEKKKKNTSKDVYKKKEIKCLINKAAFKYFIELKGQHKKLKNSAILSE